MFIQHIDNKHVASFMNAVFPVPSVSLDISAYVQGIISSISPNPETVSSAISLQSLQMKKYYSG